MDFRDSPEEAEFRTDLARWLTENAPGPIPDDPDDRASFLHEWHRTLYAAGFVGLSLPVAFGGHGRPPVLDAILNDELGAAGAPPAPAIGHLAHAILDNSTDRQRWAHLPGLLSGEVRWCQGFSEPGAGSDLAGITTRGVLDGDTWRVSGQKVWTSEAVWASWCLLLARTDPDAPRHSGLSALLVPMDADGIDCRPILTASGSREFAEVFLDDVAVAAENMLGSPGDGWAIAMGMLAYERGPADIGWVSRFARVLTEVEAAVRSGALRPSPSQRADLAAAWVDLHALQVHVQRSLSRRIAGEAPGSEGSIDKLLMTRVDQRIHHVAMDLRGAAPLLDDGLEMDGYLMSRAQSIFGGTSQIQRNIVARRVLRLPT